MSITPQKNLVIPMKHSMIKLIDNEDEFEEVNIRNFPLKAAHFTDEHSTASLKRSDSQKRGNQEYQNE